MLKNKIKNIMHADLRHKFFWQVNEFEGKSNYILSRGSHIQRSFKKTGFRAIT
jgi:hypothetical protein